MNTLFYNDELISQFNQAQLDGFERMRKFGADLMNMFAGYRPLEGDNLMGEVALRKSNVNTFAANTDFNANFGLILFTNVAPPESIAFSSLTQPTGTGYAEFSLADVDWIGSTSPFTQPEKVFIAGAGGWTGNVQGYAIVTNLNGTGARKIFVIEVDPNGPYTFAESQEYGITPALTFS